ncbi:MAG: oligosaccharide flippase family protein [Candidatus Pacearchaeota archaeon]
MLKQRLIVSLVGELIVYLIGFVSLVFIVRLMGPKPLGILTSALAIANIFSIIGNLGFGVIHVKLVSQGEDLNQCISSFFFIKLFTISLMVLSFILFSYTFPNSELSYFNFEDKYVLLIIFLSMVISSFSDIGNFTLSAQLRMAIGKTILIVQKFISSSGKIIVALMGLSAVYLASAELFATVTTLLAYIYVFRNIKISVPEKDIFKKYFKLSFPSLVITLTSVLMSNTLDRVILVKNAGVTEVGIYSVSLSMMIVFTMVANNVNNLLYPYFSKLFTKNEINKVCKKNKKIS